MTNRIFSTRLNKELDGIGFPLRTEERITAFSKLLHIPKYTAEALLQGAITPNPDLLNRLSSELEVDQDWLMGGGYHKNS
ncbi:MAG: hypothetical protein Q8R79_00185 [Legionellaceae bacterium]|nr:hypothetical protein [Legionellaceae bacterium]